MRQDRRPSTKKYQSQQTCDSMPRSAPKKIGQQTVKLTYEGLTKIPTIIQSNFIRHLYLSHNKIVTLEGIQSYTALESINISYNCIERVQELRRIHNPFLIKHIKMRMNPLPFGYEDYTISILPQLQTFQDIKISKHTRQLHYGMREFISKNIIEFIRKTDMVILLLDVNEYNKENDMNKSNKLNRESIQLNTQDQMNIRHLVEQLKALYVYPTHQSLRNMSITHLLTLSFDILKKVYQSPSIMQQTTKQHYLQTNQRVFTSLFNSILLKFSARNDKTLITQIRNSKKLNPNQDIVHAFGNLGVFIEDQVPQVEARMAGGALKSPPLVENPGKYIQKLAVQPLKQHPMNKVANWQQPQYKSLIPMEQTKWNNFYDKRSSQQMDYIYQQLPLLIYCKEYLEAITEIVLDRTSEILMLENFIHRTCNSIQNLKTIPHYLSSHQYHPTQEEIQLQLTLSDALSFGKQGREENIDLGMPRQLKANAKIIEQTVPKFSQKHKDIFAYNLSKYSLYQINLAFKVFCTLKHRMKRHREKGMQDY